MEWKSFFYKSIVARGRQYFNAGRVKRLNYRNGQWTALVRGEHHYQVRIQLDKSDNIKKMYCDCPCADSGENCKHMAAVLLAIEEKQQESTQQMELEIPQPEEEDTVHFTKMAGQGDVTLGNVQVDMRQIIIAAVFWVRRGELSVRRTGNTA